jgi:hypothetical protein
MWYKLYCMSRHSKQTLLFFIGNIIVCLTSYWPIIFSITVSLLIVTISHGEIVTISHGEIMTISHGEIVILVTISHGEINGKISKLSITLEYRQSLISVEFYVSLVLLCLNESCVVVFIPRKGISFLSCHVFLLSTHCLKL